MRFMLKSGFTVLAILTAIALVSACIAPISPPAANTEPATELIPVVIAVGAPNTPVYLNFDVAQTLGYFADTGLDVDLQYFDGGSDAAAALKNGDVDFSGNSMDHVLRAQMDGDDLRMVMNFLDHPCLALVVRADLSDEIQTPADLQGHTVGISRQGSATHILTVFVAAQAGVAASDFDVVEVGASSMPGALIAGEVDVAMGVAPYTTRLLDAGEATTLVDLCQPDQAATTIGGGMPFTGLLTRAELIADNPDVVQRVVNALVKAQQYITAHDAEQIVAALPVEATGDDAEAYTEAYTEALIATLPAFSQVGGAIDPDSLQVLLELHKTFGTITDVSDVDADALYDNQFVNNALNSE